MRIYHFEIWLINGFQSALIVEYDVTIQQFSKLGFNPGELDKSIRIFCRSSKRFVRKF